MASSQSYAGASTWHAEADAAGLEAEILAAEERLQQAGSLADPVEIADAFDELYIDDVIDIHASGWTYDKAQSIDLKQNTARNTPLRKVLVSRISPPRIVPLAADVVAVIVTKEVYFEVPDPQSMAIRAGTLGMAAEATRAAAAVMAADSGIGPGEAASPNPYRTRATRIWVRREGRWRLGMVQATRVTERVRV